MAEDLRKEILTWFVDRDAHGSQTNNRDRAIPRAAEEVSEKVQAESGAALMAEILRLRDEGLLETKYGEGPFRGAWVTTITARGRDRLFSQDDMAALIRGLENLAAALRKNKADDPAAASVEQAAKEVADIRNSSERIVTSLRSASASIKTVAAAKPAWNAVVSLANALGIHGLPEIP